MRGVFHFLLCSVVLLAFTKSAHALTYQVKLLGIASGHIPSAGHGISGDSRVGFGATHTTLSHAMLWSNDGAVFRDLHSIGFDVTVAHAVFGNLQVGRGFGTATGMWDHALLWKGTPESVVDLHPSGFRTSYAQSVWGNTQVGYGYTEEHLLSHALKWSGTAASVVDLNPPGFDTSFAYGTDGTYQVGHGNSLALGGIYRALLWNGTPESYVDLHPAGFNASYANAVSEGRIW